MISRSNKAIARQGEATIRGRMVSLTVLELVDNDLEAIGNLLGEKVEQAPEFFHNAPLLFDFQKFIGDLDIALVESVYRISLANRFTPVGITGVSNSLKNEAKLRGVAVWPSSGAVRQQEEPVPSEPEENKNTEPPESVQSGESVENTEGAEPQESEIPSRAVEQSVDKEEQQSRPEEKEEAVAETDLPSNAKTLVIRQPVRSGQKVFARGGDLIVLSSVSTGAEILADGHIHVYGTLRGRAIAGASGMEDARIFCKDLRADLIAIAGFYLTNDDLPEEKRNCAVQISLDQEQLRIDPL